MLINKTFLFKPQPFASLRVRILEGQYTLLTLPREVQDPQHVLLVEVDGEVQIHPTEGEIRLPPIVPERAIFCICTTSGDLVKWATPDGRWREGVSALADRYRRRMAPKPSAEPVAPPPKVEKVENSAPIAPAKAQVAEADITARFGICEIESETPKADPWKGLVPYLPLQKRIRDSRWAQAPQADGGYLVGMLFDSDRNPTHQCYGVEGDFAHPLSENAEWLPADEEDWQGAGWWIVYLPYTA